MNYQQGSQEWLQMRQNYVGGSDAPVIMGISPYKTIHTLWEEKLGIRSAKIANSAMQRGLEMEPIARGEFCALVGMDFQPKVVFHPTITYMMASLDGISACGKFVLEIKLAGKEDHALALKGIVPPKYFPQLQHNIECSKTEWGYYYSKPFCSEGTGNPGVFILVERDKAYIKELIEKEREFWDCVESLTAPKSPCEINDSSEWLVTVMEYESARKKRLEAEEIEQQFKDDLIRLADGKETKGAGVKLTKEVRKGSIDIERIPQLEGVDLDQFRKAPTTYWKIQRDK